MDLLNAPADLKISADLAKGGFDPLEIKDNIDHLTPERRMAWAGVLSSMATSEKAERTVMEDLRKSFAFHPAASEYLERHSGDEARHGKWLQNYTKSTFDYERTHRSLSDRVIYDRLYPWLSNRLQRRPLPFLVTVLFYERLATDLYIHLMAAAEKDRLVGLLAMFEKIQQDERRHLSGVRYLIGLWFKHFGFGDRLDRFVIWALLWLVELDVNFRSWAFYSRNLQRNFSTLDVSLNQLAKEISDSHKRVLQEVKELKAET